MNVFPLEWIVLGVCGPRNAKNDTLLKVIFTENIVFPSGEFPKDRFLILKPSNHTRLGQNHSKSHTKIEFDQRHDKILKILFFLKVNTSKCSHDQY